jgi:hypothetical protein
MTLFESSSSAQRLDLEVGFRWSDYDLAGSVTTWKAGLDWQMTESLRFRTMFQHAVRAPNNSELFTQQRTVAASAVDYFYNDPCSASSNPVANGNGTNVHGPGETDRCLEATFYPTDFIFGVTSWCRNRPTFTAGL